MEGDQRVAERQWKLNLAEFVAANHKDLFSLDGPTRDRMKAIIKLTYPESLWSPVFTSLVRASDNAAIRKTYGSIQTSVPGPNGAEPPYGGIVTVTVPKSMNIDPVLFKSLYVYMRRVMIPDSLRYPAQLVGPATAVVHTVRGLTPGTYQFWLQRRDAGGQKFSVAQLSLFDADVPVTVRLNAPTYSGRGGIP